jgi:hypothetical protein
VIEVMKVFDQSMKGWHEQESMMHSFIRDFHIPNAPLPPITSRADMRLSANGVVVRQSQHYGGGLNIACTQVPQSPGGAGGLTEGEDEKEEDHHHDDGDEGMLAVDESGIFRESNNNHRNISRRNHTQSKHNNKRANSTPTTAVQGAPAWKRGKALDGTMFPSLILDEEPIIANSGEDGEEAHDMVFDCTQVPFSQVEEQLRDLQENGKKRGRSRDLGDDCDGETMMPGMGGSSVGVGLLLGEEDNNTALPLERTASKVSQLEAPFKSEDVIGVSVSHCDFNLLSQDSAVRGSTTTTNNTSTSGGNNCKSSSGDMGPNQINGGNKKVSHAKEEEVDDGDDDVDDDDESLILTRQSKSKYHNRSKKNSKPDNKKREIRQDLDETQDVSRHDDPILGNFDSMMEE